MDHAQHTASAPRIKSKMKRADPENFSIHDFMAECKSADAADSRFTEERETQRFEFAVAKGELEPVYRRVSELLVKSGRWQKKHDATSRYHLLLGARGGANIPFKRFAQLFKWDYGITPHCNYFRGFENVTKNTDLVLALRKLEMDNGSDVKYPEDTAGQGFMPRSYLFFTAKPEESEEESLVATFESNTKRGKPNLWVIEASIDTPAAEGGPRREPMRVICADLDSILAHVRGEQGPWMGGKKLPYSFVVQEKMEAPLCLASGHSVQVSALVLVDHRFGSYMYTRLQAHPCAEPVQESQPLQVEQLYPDAETIENDSIPGEQLNKMLSSLTDLADPVGQLVGGCKNAVAKVLEAGKRYMQSAEHADFTAFQLMSFRFLVDETLTPWLLSVDAAPSVQQEDVNEVAVGVMRLAIEPLFEGSVPDMNPGDQVVAPGFVLVAAGAKGAESPKSNQEEDSPRELPIRTRANKK